MKPETLFSEIRRLREHGIICDVMLFLKDGTSRMDAIDDVLCDTLRTMHHIPLRADEISTGLLIL